MAVSPDGDSLYYQVKPGGDIFRHHLATDRRERTGAPKEYDSRLFAGPNRRSLFAPLVADGHPGG